MTIKELLNSIGMSGKSQHVYLTLLSLNDISASELAKKTNLKRTSTYEILNQLLDIGLVVKRKKSGRFVFNSENPNKIKYLLEQKIYAANELLPALNSIYKTAQFRPKIKIAEGKKAILLMNDEALNCHEKIHRLIGSHWHLNKLTGETHGYAKRRMAKRIFRNSLLSQNKLISEKYLSNQNQRWRDIRLLPKQFEFRNSILTYDDKTIFYLSPGEDTAISIESKSLSNTIKQIFDDLWEKSETTN